jgi:3-hydroxybutyryl-CoA dehydrogenase
MEIKTFGVIGAGQMGNGIAQVAAASGLNVVMNDIKESFVQRGLKTIEKFFDRGIEKGKLTPGAERSTVLGRIKPSTDINDMAGPTSWSRPPRKTKI